MCVVLYGVKNLDTERRTWAEGIQERGAEEDVSILEGEFTGTGGYCSAGGLASIPLTKERKGGTRRVKHMGEKRSAFRVLVGKPEERRPLGGIRRRWETNIKVDLMYDFREWIVFIWLRRRTNGGLM
jgi:hypothetical protein